MSDDMISGSGTLAAAATVAICGGMLLAGILLVAHAGSMQQHYSPPDTKGCGIAIDENLTMQYTTHGMIMAGKVPMTTTTVHRFYDLICTNGTVVPGWRS